MRAAVGWIGFVCAVPFAGAALYGLFGVNRVERLAAVLSQERPVGRQTDAQTVGAARNFGHLQQVADVSASVSGNRLVGGNLIEPLTDGTTAYPRMLEAIERAERSIALSTYIFRADRIGTRFVNALTSARDRGVEVRVIIDSIGSGVIYSPVANRLRRAGISVTLFARDVRPRRMSVLNLRNHKKLLVVDGCTGFVGGLNLGEENDSVGVDRVRDVHFELRGPIVAQLLNSFASDLEYATSERLRGENWWPDLVEEGTTPARGVSSGPDGSVGSIAMLMAAAVTEAETAVRIVTPYFLPDQAMLAFLRLSVLKGVDVDVVIPAVSDQFLPHWAMQAQLRFMQASSVRFHLGPAPFDHSKLVTVDGRWCAFGSPNWDPRSLRLNFEFLVEAYDVDVTARVDALINEKITAARPAADCNMFNASLPVKLRDAAARLLAPYL